MKIYTRQGDDGSTGLFGGQRLSKSDPRFQCTGDIDELNAALGLAAVTLDRESADMVRQIQNDLFVIGSHLGALDPGNTSHLPKLTDEMVARLEQQIDAAEAQLPPLKNFILPGGSEGVARLHLARTVCRRAERAMVGYAQDHVFEPIMMKYVNRLSDWLFVQARLTNNKSGIADILWK